VGLVRSQVGHARLPFARTTTATLLALTLITAAPGSAQALASPRATWTIQPTPNASAPQVQLTAVACQSDCVAVGTAVDHAGQAVTLAEVSSATGWTTVATPNPNGAPGAGLLGVSCPAAGWCIAVGSRARSTSRLRPLAEIFRNGRWSIAATPVPPSATFTELDGVSCTSTTACTAVGSYLSSSNLIETLAERWDGAAWTIQPTPNPPTIPNVAQLAAVSCASATSCMAVGSFETMQTTVSFAERWNGTRWTILSTPNHGETHDTAVSCTSPRSCTAVGYAITRSTGTDHTVVQEWDGAAWTAPAGAMTAGTDAASFAGVSCGTTSCVAVGSQVSGTGGRTTLAARRSGTTWTVEPAPAGPRALASLLTSVACPSATTCVAVGDGQRGGNTDLALTEVWHPNQWTLTAVHNPRGAEDNNLGSVSCSSATACTAVGSADGNTLAENWDGTGWSIRRTANSPMAGAVNVLNSVTCSTATSCAAVGYAEGLPKATLVERWDGASWVIEPSPNAGREADNELTGVSCAAPASCLAVGGSDTASGGLVAPLSESFNGSSWTIKHVPLPSGALGGELLGVSCVTAADCTAAGFFFPSYQHDVPLLEHWNGTTWAAVTPPAPSRGTNGDLAAVDCLAGAGCVAVGTYGKRSGRQLAFSVAGHGSTWAEQDLVNPASSQATSAAGVSCVAHPDFACTAVGSRSDPSGITTLAESWDGTRWSVQRSPDKPGQFNFLSGVSCTGAAACTAVGFFAPSQGALGGNLVERYSPR
jgi:hypothetical protein